MKIKPKLAAGVTLSVLSTLLLLSSCYTVAEYERTVVTRFGKVVDVAGPGLGFRMPIVNGLHTYRIDIQALIQDRVNTYTIDNQELDALFTVNFRIPADQVVRIYSEVPDYEARLTTLAVDRFKAEMGKINVSEVAERRGDVAMRIKTVLAEQAKLLFGLEVVDFQINNIDFTQAFRNAVNEAAVAKANVERAEQQKRQAEVDAATVQIKAQGEANARVTAAKAEAEAIKLNGEAQGAAIRAQAAALAENGRLVELRKAERWDGKLPVQVLSGVLPMMQFKAAE